ncbi:MAG: hypothetical protein AB7O52_00825 [Planctomycetota bacterium]
MYLRSPWILTLAMITTCGVLHGQSAFIRGDANANGSVDIADAVFNLDFLFNGGAPICLDAQDSNDDGQVNLADPVFSLAYQFSGGMSPTAPFPACGNDPTVDAIDCAGPVPACPTGPIPTAFRITSLNLRDPHAFTQVILCLDSTATLNGLINDTFTQDQDMDGSLDLSYLLIFRPLDQAGAMGNLDFVLAADCTAPAAGTTCDLDAFSTSVALTYTNPGAGSCLGLLPGTTTGSFTPAPSVPSTPCFVTDPATISLDLGGILVTLQEGQIAGSYVGNPATSITNGLGRGFVSEASANAITIPATIPLVGGMPLSALLPGGMGNCSSIDARDMGPTGTLGWWVYFNFSATAVPYTGP